MSFPLLPKISFFISETRPSDIMVAAVTARSNGAKTPGQSQVITSTMNRAGLVISINQWKNRPVITDQS